ncbi:class I SAM-dependent methyltransferase [Candidatus Dependentiae bacterium]
MLFSARKKHIKEKRGESAYIMEEIGCIFCQKREEAVFLEENGYKGRKCSECGLIYVSPRPDPNNVVDLYGHDDAFLSAQDHIKSEFSKRLNARHNLKLVCKHAKGGSLLEIGAGAGFFLSEAKKKGFEPYGVELNQQQGDFIRNRFNIPCEDSLLSQNTFGGRTFDVIYHCDVASHFSDPIADFAMMNSRLNKNGILVFETGNLGDVPKNYFNYIERLQYPDHLFFFTENNLKDLLEQTGFTLIKTYRYNILPQLRLMKLLKRIFKKNGATNSARNQTPTKNIKEPTVKKLLHNGYHYLNYVFRYKLGAVMPKKRQPQTLILIARKK